MCADVSTLAVKHGRVPERGSPRPTPTFSVRFRERVHCACERPFLAARGRLLKGRNPTQNGQCLRIYEDNVPHTDTTRVQNVDAQTGSMSKGPDDLALCNTGFSKVRSERSTGFA